MKPNLHLFKSVVALAIFTVSTATVQAEDYLYETNKGTVTITKHTGPGGDVTIPETINGLPVTTIGVCAFEDCTSLTSISIPSSVTNLEDAAFWGCTNLTGVTIPNSVTSIGNYAFYECASLISVAIPNSVTRIGYYAFSRCSSLTGITVPASVANWGVYCSSTGCRSGTFGGCTNLTSVTISDGVRQIPVAAFSGCSSLANVTIPNSVTSIDSGAFSDCISLTSVTIGNSVTNIGAGGFAGCTSLSTVTIPDGVTSIGVFAFDSCTSLTSITIPNSVTTIGHRAFWDCISLRAVYFAGNAAVIVPDFEGHRWLFGSESNTIVSIAYYLPGTTGWDTTFGGRPTAPWLLPYPVILTTAPNFGIQNNAFGFRISWATNVAVVVEASATLANPGWSPVSTNTLVDGWSDFSDAEWTNHPARFYRSRSP